MYIYDLDNVNPHVGIFGKTGSGKTKYTQALIKQQLVRSIDKANVYIFTTNTNSDEWSDYKVYDDFDKYMDAIWTKHTTQKTPALIVFDDYLNTDAYSFNNKKLQRLFSEGRKHLIHGIIQSHEPNKLASGIRNSLSYKVVFPSNDINFINKIADNFLVGDKTTLTRIFRDSKNQPSYTAVVIPPNAEPFFDRSEASNVVEARQSVSTNIQNNGDNNTNHVFNNTSLELRDLVQKNKIAHEIAIQQIKDRHEEDSLKKVYETKILCLKSYLDQDQKYMLIDNLNYLKKSGQPVTMSTLKQATQVFMHKKFPEANYVCCWSDEITASKTANKMLESGPRGSLTIGAQTLANLALDGKLPFVRDLTANFFGL